jgi:hypothetical protein
MFFRGFVPEKRQKAWTFAVNGHRVGPLAGLHGGFGVFKPVIQAT